MAKRKTRASKVFASPDVPKHWRDLFALLPGYDPIVTAGDCEFRASVADTVVSFFHDHLTHIEGKWCGKPLTLEPWQQAVVGCAFGWFRPDGTRRYREVFLYVPRKNGKSTLLGGLVNMVALLDREPGAQIYSAAADREQAALVYRQAKGMLLNNPVIAEGTKVYATYKSIEYPGGQVYKALSADADTKHGFNTHLCVVDELHAHPNGELVDVLNTSMGARRQPMMFYITTADHDRPSICNEKYNQAKNVRDGVTPDIGFLPVIYEASIDDDWTDPDVWAKANPNLGVSVNLDYLARECQKAKELPRYSNTFKRLHLNVRTQQDVLWLPLERWDACAGAVNAESLKGRECVAALDLANKWDVAALVLMFSDDNGCYDLLPFMWIPSEVAKVRDRKENVPWLAWHAAGHVLFTEGDATDYQQIEATIKRLSTEYRMRELAFDPWNATQMAMNLMAYGVDCVQFNQNMTSMNEPTKEFERIVRDGRLRHGGHPVMRWMASNASVKEDHWGNIRPIKPPKDDKRKIDAIVASIMALGRLITTAKPQQTVYADRGVIVL